MSRSVMSTDATNIDITKEDDPQQTGIRDITQNYEVLFALDRALSTVASVQRTLHCCGLESSEDWLNHFSGNFAIVEPSRYKVWWMNTSRPSRFPLSCCSWDALCGNKISGW
uniref:Uncharacterized protein n=1 Tax=Parascaris univalens TaxID=6257 RepID=A0A915A2K6_PARUN